ncbi:unnamed protein product [Vicia faba]|uniref:Uncharacterized protein n=1 Tax=Vicia faba TaxID=3906 RepID=A0AAV0ZK63_VICFA|nr:unnamed protein product [Vicia faba]
MKQNGADDGLLCERSYDEEIMNLHVTHLEEEIIKLKGQVEKSENKVDDLSEKLKLKEEELHNLKEFSDKVVYKSKVGLVVIGSFCCFFYLLDLLLLWYSLCLFLGFYCIFSEKLKSKKEELRNLKEFSDKEIYNLKAQIEECEAKKHVHEIANEKLKISEDENEVLRKELESKSCETHELQGQLIEAEENMAESDLELVSGRKHIQILENLVIIYEQEVQKLKSKMLDSQDNF